MCYLSSARAPILGALPGLPCPAQRSYLGSLTSSRRMKSLASSLVLLKYTLRQSRSSRPRCWSGSPASSLPGMVTRHSNWKADTGLSGAGHPCSHPTTRPLPRPPPDSAMPTKGADVEEGRCRAPGHQPQLCPASNQRQ